MFIVVVRECYRCCEDVLKQRAEQGKESDILFEVQKNHHKHDGKGGEDNETDDEEEYELCDGVTASCGPFKYHYDPARALPQPRILAVLSLFNHPVQELSPSARIDTR